MLESRGTVASTENAAPAYDKLSMASVRDGLISMKVLRSSLFVLASVWSSYACAQPLTNLDFPYNFTQAQIVPSGCMAIPPSLMSPPEDVEFDEVISVGSPTQQISIRAWRFGCHEPGRSAIAVSFGVEFGSLTELLAPFVDIRSAGSEETIQGEFALFSDQSDLEYIFQTSSLPSLNLATRFPFRPDVTFIVHSISSPDAIEEYNGELELILDFGLADNAPAPITIPISAYQPGIHLPQSELPPFHGRYSGQWVVEGLPNTGLLLQFGEVPGTTRNFVFAIWITYINGQPTWIVGNTDFEIGSNEIEIEMLSFEGGGFLTDVGGFVEDDIDSTPLGTMTIRANHCNEIEADIDLSMGDLGTTNLTLSRLIRIAGYDCDQTQ